MARKSDLLTLLSKRSNDAAPAARTSEKPKAPAQKLSGRGASQPTLAASIKSWFARLKPGAGPGAGQQPSPPARSAQATQVALPMFGLVAIVLCALGLGFVLGRAFGGRPDPTRGAQERELRSGNAAGKQGIEAGWLVDPSESPRGQEMQAQVMAKWYLPVIVYEAHLKPDAIRLAEYLREHQIHTARILYFESVTAPGETVGKPCWGTVVYLPSKEETAHYLEQLRNVPPPAFESSFSDSLKKLETLVASGIAPRPSSIR